MLRQGISQDNKTNTATHTHTHTCTRTHTYDWQQKAVTERFVLLGRITTVSHRKAKKKKKKRPVRYIKLLHIAQSTAEIWCSTHETPPPLNYWVCLCSHLTNWSYFIWNFLSELLNSPFFSYTFVFWQEKCICFDKTFQNCTKRIYIFFIILAFESTTLFPLSWTSNQDQFYINVHAVIYYFLKSIILFSLHVYLKLSCEVSSMFATSSSWLVLA